MVIEENSIVNVKNSNSGYKGRGVVVGLVFANTYMVQTEDPNRPVITVKHTDLEVIGKQEPAKSVRNKKEEVPEEALEGRRDYDMAPTDGKKNKNKKGNGKRLPKRARAGTRRS